MALSEISSKKKWEKAHHLLNMTFEKEIRIMREILASLHQEELSLLENNLREWQKVMKDRSDFIVQLKDQRFKRMLATEGLTKIAVELQKKELLPAEEELSCEIFSKLDQIIALLDRINLQNCRNDALFDQVKQREELPLYCSFPHPLHEPKKRKTSVAVDSSIL